jgi:hypothetical protein
VSNRREFITLLGSATAWPFASRAQQRAIPAAGAQQASIPVVGYLSGAAAQPSERLVAALKKGLGEAGYAEGRNVALDYRFAADRYDRLPALATELVSRKAAVIFASGIQQHGPRRPRPRLFPSSSPSARMRSKRALLRASIDRAETSPGSAG